MRRIWAGLTLLVASALAAGTALAQSTLKVAPTIVPRILDPHITTAIPTRHFGYLVYDTLFALDDKFEPQPQMVASYTLSPDKRTYTFKLRPGLKWHDGQSVTAADCVASLKRWAPRDPMGEALLRYTSSLEEVDAETFRLELKRPYDLVLDTLAKPGAPVPFMIPARLAKTPLTEPIPEAIGSGPYRLRTDLLQPGKRVVVDRFAGYVPRTEPTSWMAGAKLAKIERVEFLDIAKGPDQVNALLRGEIDFIEELPVHLQTQVDATPGAIASVLGPYGEQAVLRLNHLQPPFDSLTVRQAIARAVDRKRYANVVAGDPRLATDCAAMFGCRAPFSSGEGVPAHDMSQARSFLRTAGVDQTKPIVMLHVTDAPPIAAIGAVTQQILTELGFKVEVVPLDFQSFVYRRTNPGPTAQGGWNVAHTTYSLADQYNPLSNPFLVALGPPVAQWGWPLDEELELLKNKFGEATDISEQRRFADRIQARAYEQVTYLPLAQFTLPSAWGANLSGLMRSPVLLLYNIEKR